MRRTIVIQSREQELYTEVNIIVLSAEYDKRVIMKDGISTKVYGHFSVR